MNPKTPTQRHIIIKMASVKEKVRVLKAAVERVTYNRVTLRLSADFSIETLEARRDWHELFKMIKNNDLQPELL